MTEPSTSEPIAVVVEARAHGWRIDHYLTRLYPNYSRAAFQKAIDLETILLNGLPVKSGRRLRVNDTLSVRLPELPDETILPEDIPLDVLYEDEWIAVINKSADLIVHPGKGNYRGTLAGALQFHFDRLSDVAGKFRPGIVHRLDRHTTGVMVVAKDNQCHGRLSAQFESREVRKEYLGIVWGQVQFDSDYIETHVRVSPKNRERMQVCQPTGNSREAVTYYEVLERFPRATFVRLMPKTGRTHQLRVHFQHLGHTMLADSMYGSITPVTPAMLTERDAPHPREPDRVLIQRQALHAFRLSFAHPQSGKTMEFEAPLPEDMQRTLDFLRAPNS
jgi:23S rRNA pseudouridine1911/1915/1917 synthase